MKQPPTWCTELPLDAEGRTARYTINDKKTLLEKKLDAY